MKKIISATLVCFCSAVAFISCESKLDIDQKGVDSLDGFFKTDEECEEAATAIYGQFASQNFDAGFYLEGMLDDDSWAGGDNRTANVFLEALNEFRYTSSTGSIETAFSDDYKLIYRSNLLINKVKDPDSATKKRDVAEAYFFRAYAYLDLVTIFGPAPKVTSLVEDGNYKVGNSTVEELYELIESDLQAALALDALPEKSSIDDNVTGIRVTKQTAQALLGKAYLFDKKYEEAAAMLDNVINSGKYGLFQGEYGDIFAAKNNFNREIMLAVNKVNDPNKYSFSAINVFHGWRVDRLEGLATSSMDVYNMGWGFGVPTKDLYDAFVEMEGPDGYRLNQTLCTYDRLVANGVKVVDGQFIYGCEGYLSWKFRNTKDSYVDGTWAGFYNNECAMRYAEVLLLASEANLMAGNADKAAAYLNQVRERAKLAPKSNITLDDIKKEKRLELCGENVRFKDLVRWGDAAEVLKDRGAYYPSFYGYKPGTTEYNVVYTKNSGTYGFKAGKHELLPFPETELQVNPLIKQNPGW